MGLVPHDTAPDGFGNFSNNGPMARTVADTALMLSVMAGPHPNDPHSHGLPRDDFCAAAEGAGDLSGVKIGWLSYMGNELVDASTNSAMLRALLGSAGSRPSTGSAGIADELPRFDFV